MTVSAAKFDPRNNAFLRRLFQPKRIPLLFSVTIVASIFYHYAPSMTWLWVLLATLLQAVFYRLFDFVNKHHVLGGLAYCAVGLVVMTAALTLARAGYDSPFFSPDDPKLRIHFFVWFLTPLSVLSTTYYAYTAALFLMFSFFIASITYYFTIVRYRVLMSFVSMIFPFAIYAKENETMPVPAIILLFVCYFAVMIYCRQAHAEDPAVVQAYVPEMSTRLKMPPKRSAFAGKLPEILDGTFAAASGIFLAAAVIIVLILPKPAVSADRTAFDNMLNMSAVSDYLMGAISGFTDSSDGGGRGSNNLDVALYYANAEEPLNLRVRTFTDYSYAEDKWTASAYDKQPAENDARFRLVEWGNVTLHTVCAEQSPAELLQTIRDAALADSAFAEKWHLTEFAAQPIDTYSATKNLSITATNRTVTVCPAPGHTVPEGRLPRTDLYQNSSGIIFRAQPAYSFACSYISDALSRTDAAQQMMRQFSAEEWSEFLLDLQKAAEKSGDEAIQNRAQNAADCYLAAVGYADHVHSATPARVAALAHELTDSLHSDYEKAAAICAYLKSGEYTYSLDFAPSDTDNAETFLFTNKQGVCYQFATAMAELCRAVGLPTRYIEGYAMQQENSGLGLNSQYKYIITTKHAHAFVEVFVAGYGWLMFDATAVSDLPAAQDNGGVIATLQYSGLILSIAAVLLIVLIVWVIPMLRERLFRRRFRRSADAASVIEAFLRLRRQWKADPAATARDLCAAQSAFLGLDLGDLLHAFECAVYAARCTPEDAARAYAVYCAAYDAWRPACRRKKRAEREAARAARKAASA